MQGKCLLLDLPAELRLRIFECALAPTGALSLTATKTKRFKVFPDISPGLLRTCQQLHREATNILYSENEVCIIVDAHDTCYSTISESRLPQGTLGRIERMCVILDCTDYFNASYADVDFAPFAALTSLKSMRFAMIFRKHSGSQTLGSLHIAELREFNVVAQILERISAEAKLEFGVTLESQQDDMVKQLIDVRARGRGGVIRQASGKDLKDAAEGVRGLVRGCKCRKTADVYAESRAFAEKSR